MSKLSEREDALFDSWRQRLGQDSEGFVADGAVCGDTFESTNTRIVFLLKEVNDPGGGKWDLREFLRNGGRGATWNNVTRWSMGILALPQVLRWVDIEDIDKSARIRTLRKIAAVNLKKAPGGAAADVDGLREFARENREFLRRQLKLYRPDLIVGCGSDVTAVFFDVVYPEPNWCRSARGTWYAEIDGAVYLDYYHPNARILGNLLHYGLIDSVRNLPGSRRFTGN